MSEALQAALLPLLGAVTAWLSVRSRERRKAREYVAANPRRIDDTRIAHVEVAVKHLDGRVRHLEIGSDALGREIRDARADLKSVVVSVDGLREDLSQHEEREESALRELGEGIARHAGKVDEALEWIKAGLKDRKG